MNPYQDTVEVDTLDGLMDVQVSTWGRPDELGPAERAEGWPVRLRVTDDEERTAEAYLSLSEAEQVIEELRAAVERARTFPQPVMAR